MAVREAPRRSIERGMEPSFTPPRLALVRETKNSSDLAGIRGNVGSYLSHVRALHRMVAEQGGA